MKILLFLAAGMLAGCAVKPVYSPPAAESPGMVAWRAKMDAEIAQLQKENAQLAAQRPADRGPSYYPEDESVRKLERRVSGLEHKGFYEKMENTNRDYGLPPLRWY